MKAKVDLFETVAITLNVIVFVLIGSITIAFHKKYFYFPIVFFGLTHLIPLIICPFFTAIEILKLKRSIPLKVITKISFSRYTIDVTMNKILITLNSIVILYVCYVINKIGLKHLIITFPPLFLSMFNTIALVYGNIRISGYHIDKS